MAVLKSIVSGNWTTAATWGLVDSTSYLNSENATESLLTTAYSATRSSAFTPGAIVVSHLGVKLCERIGTTGTMSVSLRNSTLGLDDFVTGTEVTIDVADLPSALEADLNGGWIHFKLSSPVTLLAATAYNIQAKSSSATQVDLWCDGTVDNLARTLVTTTTQAPVAGDDLIVSGEFTAAGASSTFTVTMNQTATTDYGSASTSLVTPALAICTKGVLTWGTTAATNYNLKLSGNLIVYSGGTYNQGTTGTPCPRDSTMKLNFDCGANVDFGMVVRNLGTVSIQGQSRTSGKNIVKCMLNTDEAAAQTVLGVDTDTGWLSGDEIGIASTTRTASQTERRTLSGNAGASDMTVTAGLTNAHSGTSPTQAEVILLTRNVSVFGTSVTVQAYIDIKPTATVDADWCEFYFMGSATANKRGIDIATTTGSSAFTFCSFRDWVVSTSGIVVTGAASDNYTIQNCTIYASSSAFVNVVTSGTAWVLDNIIAMGCTGTGFVISLADIGGTFTNISSVGNSNTNIAIVISQSTASLGTFSNITYHSNVEGASIIGPYSGTVTNITCWRNNTTPGLQLTNLGDGVLIDGLTMFGNLTSNLSVSSSSGATIKSAVISGDTTFSTVTGLIVLGNIGGSINIESSTFGVASGIMVPHTTADITISSPNFSNILLQNTSLASSTEVSVQTTLAPGSFISSQKHDQTTNLHKKFKREGTISIDTVIFDSTPSVRLTPLSATENLDSIIFRSAVTSGSTLAVTVKVRESVAGDGTDYNGNRIRLIVKKNVAAGITADTVLATATVASEGAFETLSGTTASVTDNAVLEFSVDCDGTTGWVNADTWTVSTQTNTKGLAYWCEGRPFVYGDNSSGGGSSATIGYASMS